MTGLSQVIWRYKRVFYALSLLLIDLLTLEFSVLKNLIDLDRPQLFSHNLFN